jgi:hypothetical protein
MEKAASAVPHHSRFRNENPARLICLLFHPWFIVSPAIFLRFFNALRSCSALKDGAPSPEIVVCGAPGGSHVRLVDVAKPPVVPRRPIPVLASPIS